jgi:hypothetical protein
MSHYLTSSKLITSVKRRALIPQNQSTFTDEDFLELANEEVSLGILPSMLRLHEDYLLYTEEIPLVSSQSNYTIPSRAIGNKLREISFKDSNGNIYEMTRIGIGDLSEYNSSYSSSLVRTFYIENNEVILVPNISGGVTGSLMMSYYLRPNALVLEERAAKILSIDTVTGTLIVDAVPTTFSTADDNGQDVKYDLIKSTSPFITAQASIIPSAINSVTKEIVFDPNDLPATLRIGDYVNFEHECVIPQIPQDLHVILAHRVATRCLEALGDAQGLQLANQKLAEMEENTSNLIDNRVEDAPRKVINRHSILKQGLYRKNWRSRR